MKKIVLVSIIFGLLALSSSFAQTKKDFKGLEILGAGATFPQVLYSKMFSDYGTKFNAKINYQGIGSGGGIKQLTSKTIDFGGTDAFMEDKEITAAGAPIVHIPTCLGAVVLTYNLEGNPALKLTPEIIAAIYLGKITKWNDKLITTENPSVKLPAIDIFPVRRSDGSGTTFVFTDYLAKVSKEWKEKVGTGKEVNWPAGLGGKGNPGVQGLVNQLPGSIGYVELIYAKQNKMPYASVKNKSGAYIIPSMDSVTKSANVTIPDDTRVSITDTDAKDGYPISSFTWLIVYKEQKYGNKKLETASAVADLLWWVTHDGQSIPATLDFAPLPKAVVEKAEKIIKSITYDGKTFVK